MVKRFIKTIIPLCMIIVMTGCSFVQKNDTTAIRDDSFQYDTGSTPEESSSYAVTGSAYGESDDPDSADIAEDSIDVNTDDQLVLMSKNSEPNNVKKTSKTSNTSSTKVTFDVEKYLASLGTTLEKAKEQAEQVHKEEVEKLNKLKEEKKTWDELVPTSHMTFAELVGDNEINEYPSGFMAPDTYKIIVDLKYQVVMIYTKDDKGDYTIPVRYMLCSSGADKTGSPVGTFEMKDYRVRHSIFKGTDNYGQYWSLITGRIYFHSILYTSMDDDDYIESTWRNLGTNVSHGCIRLTVPDARFIYYNCAPGTVVEIRKGSSSDKETKKLREKLLESKAEVPSKRITITPETLPYTDNWRVEDIPHEVTFVNGHQ